MICTDCRIDYPEGCVHRFFANGTYTALCGICALARVNQMAGTRWQSFHGDEADYARQLAVQHRLQIGYVAPRPKKQGRLR